MNADYDEEQKLWKCDSCGELYATKEDAEECCNEEEE